MKNNESGFLVNFLEISWYTQAWNISSNVADGTILWFKKKYEFSGALGIQK